MKSELLLNEPLAPYTSWHIGGKADRFYRPIHQNDLQAFLKALSPTEPLTWLGLGSNVLISDEGLQGSVIHTLSMKSDIELVSESVVRASMGVPCAKLAKFCAKHHLKGGEFFAGIPGTVGGALAMNAGAFGGETWKQVHKVEVITRTGNIFSRLPEDYEIGYRTVRLKQAPMPEEWFLAGFFQFEKDENNLAAQGIKQLLKKRNETQPIGVFSCGSVFKNPAGAFVGKLIDSSGLKGKRIGEAEISLKHANFIINLGKATAKDVLALISLVVEKVYHDHQILLEPEVRFLGFKEMPSFKLKNNP